MEITELVEKNASLLRLGLHLEYNDARHRIANHLQRNIDRSKYLEYETRSTKRYKCTDKKSPTLFLATDIWFIYIFFKLV